MALLSSQKTAAYARRRLEDFDRRTAARVFARLLNMIPESFHGAFRAFTVRPELAFPVRVEL